MSKQICKKLSEYAKERGILYRTAWEHFRTGKIEGAFKSKNGTIINADLNGAYNILRKAIPNAFADGIEGFGVNPKVLHCNL